jgi:hypothetical protein
VDEKLAGRLTAYEAEQFADILRELAATLRREETERPAREFAQAVAKRLLASLTAGHMVVPSRIWTHLSGQSPSERKK